MATTFQTLIDEARLVLLEGTSSFWTDAELLSHATRGARDLWKAIKDTYQDYFLTHDITSVSMAAGATTLSGVPSDVAIVRGIEPRDLTATANTNLFFEPRDFYSPEFRQARAEAAVDPVSRIIFYDISGAGAPVAAPVVTVAPKITATVLLRFSYIPVIGALTTSSNNPCGGETDQAIISWTIGYARAKEREDRKPDPEWMAIYATEKANLISSITPRQFDQEQYAEALFEPYWVD
jgi:hypothetical protein